MGDNDTHQESAFSLESLLDELRISRTLRRGSDPRQPSRDAGPEVSYGLPHRGERRRAE
jgi:hypothetical protein